MDELAATTDRAAKIDHGFLRRIGPMLAGDDPAQGESLHGGGELMKKESFSFDDGNAYEATMAAWLRPVGETFFDWLEAKSGLKWIDVGCGTGVSTELLIEKCTPAEVEALDPSNAQLAVARTRPVLHDVTFHNGDAVALPFSDNSFDAALMAGVIPVLPDLSKGVIEMLRVVRPSGLVAAYMWDIVNGGFPHEPVLAGLTGC